jgi:bifunctional UDP-N-acetylglucosamine pyrophosphorylase/glucosamine-1-phosphate N-acetyltransferase
MKPEILGIILSAGKSTRFKSSYPKVIHKILGKPMFFYPFYALSTLKPEYVAFIVGHKKEKVIEIIKQISEEVPSIKIKHYIQENPKGGTADAVLSAKELLKKFPNSIVFILNGDTPLITSESLKKGLDKFINNNLDLLIYSSILENPTGYGRILRDKNTGTVKKIIEEKDASPKEKEIKEVNAGYYIVKSSKLLKALEKIKPSPITGELYLTDIVEILSNEGAKIDTLIIPPEEIYGVNTREQLAIAEKILLKRKISSLQKEGVTIRLPETVYIEWDVKIERDTEIEPHCVIKGQTHIEEGCFIGAGSIIEDSHIETNSRILPYSYISSSVIGKNSLIGPFARIRDGALIHERVEIGNFVEVKKSIIHKETKAKHLSYIGDAEIGQNTNIGAGTVFANYDGRKKHKTIVGQNVFIGSNSLIIAPRKLEDYSFIAGGSVVNKDVPSYALAISRAPLKILENKNPLIKKTKG